MPKTFRDSLNERLKDPVFRAEWEALETEREIGKAIINGKPLTGYTPQQIAEAAGVSLKRARIMQKGKPTLIARVSKYRLHATVR